MKTAEQWASDPRCGLGDKCSEPCNPPDFPEIGACDWCVLVETFTEALTESRAAGYNKGCHDGTAEIHPVLELLKVAETENKRLHLQKTDTNRKAGKLAEKNIELQQEVKRVRAVLKQINAVKAPPHADVENIGDKGMSIGERAVTMALGKCIVLAHEALDPEYYGSQNPKP